MQGPDAVIKQTDTKTLCEALARLDVDDANTVETLLRGGIASEIETRHADVKEYVQDMRGKGFHLTNSRAQLIFAAMDALGVEYR